MARAKAKFRVGQVVAFVDAAIFGRIFARERLPKAPGEWSGMAWYYSLEDDGCGPYHESHLRQLTKREKGEA